MSKIALIAKMTAREGKLAEMQELIGELCVAADEEPGLEVYAAHTNRDEPGVVYFYELYTDGDALKVHGKGERMRAAMAKMGAVTAGPPEITVIKPFAAKGLAL